MSSQNNTSYLTKLEEDNKRLKQDNTRLEEDNMSLRTERKKKYEEKSALLFKRSMILMIVAPIIGATKFYNYNFVQGTIFTQSVLTLVGLRQSKEERKTLISLGVLENKNANKATLNLMQSFSFKKK
jgi:hypothetical protein